MVDKPIKEVEEQTENQKSWRDTGIRLLFVILFALIYSAAEVVMALVIVVQFGFAFIAGGQNQKLMDFGTSLSKFIYLILKYATFQIDEKPFPFSDWPTAPKDVKAKDSVTKK